MVAASTFYDSSLTKKVNIFCLLVAIALVLFLPFKKEIWYDETVSVLCSKGIGHDTPQQFDHTDTLSSATIAGLNTASRVFHATVVDNGNSYLYNISLHWFTALAGNSITAYMLWSKLIAIAGLIAFYFLCSLFFRQSMLMGIAVLLLATDANFINMSHEIRAYGMGILFVTLAAYYFFRYSFYSRKTRYLFLFSLFSAAALLSHFLAVYILLVLACAIIYYNYPAIFSFKNICTLLLPLAVLAVYFYLSYAGLHTMNAQNAAIEKKFAPQNFSVREVFMRSLKITAGNFKILFPSFRDNASITIISFLMVAGMYWLGIKAAIKREDKRNLRLLFLLGIMSSVFLLSLSLKAGHYTPLYYRYYSFSLPFCNLFIACLLHVIWSSPHANKLIKAGLPVLLFIPSIAFFIVAVSGKQVTNYNHPAVAARIANDNIPAVGVPGWNDALLLQSFLPKGYKIDYFRNGAANFVLYKSSGVEKIPVITETR